jgi:hypothetical protein
MRKHTADGHLNKTPHFHPSDYENTHAWTAIHDAFTRSKPDLPEIILKECSQWKPEDSGNYDSGVGECNDSDMEVEEEGE